MTAIFRDTEIYFQMILFVDSSAVRAFPLVAHSCTAFSADIWLAGLVEIAAQGIIVEGYEQRIAYIVECCKAEHDIADGADTARPQRYRMASENGRMRLTSSTVAMEIISIDHTDARKMASNSDTENGFSVGWK